MKKLLIIIFGLLYLLSASAQIRGNNIVVMVQPDHSDWNYVVGETVFLKLVFLNQVHFLIM